jgi:single-strand DNA-binding protein
MAASLNKVFLAGRLGQDPQLRMVNGDQPVTSLRLAVKNYNGKEEETYWFNVTVWGKQAELCVEHLEKGSTVVVEARLKPRVYTEDHPEHGPLTRSTLEVVADRVQFL